MTSLSRKTEAKRKAKRRKAGLKRKKLVNREGSTLSSEQLFTVKKED